MYITHIPRNQIKSLRTGAFSEEISKSKLYMDHTLSHGRGPKYFFGAKLQFYRLFRIAIFEIFIMI